MRSTAILLVTIALLAGFEKCSAQQQQQQVTITLKVIEIDKNGERPTSGMFVQVFPKADGVAEGYTDANGFVAFEFNSSDIVKFRVGTKANTVGLAPLSGRFSQTTSYVLDRRPKKTCCGETTSMPGFDEKYYSMLEMLNDFWELAGGRLMNEQSREYLSGIKERVDSITSSDKAVTDFDKQRLSTARSELLERVNQLLEKPYKMGLVYVNDPSGVRVESVTAGGPADKARIQVGDVITEFNHEALNYATHPLSWLIANSTSSSVTITLKRGDTTQDVNVDLRK